MLTAKWSFQTGQMVDSTSQAVALTDATNTTAVTGFHLVKPAGWPAGDAGGPAISYHSNRAAASSFPR